MLVFTRIASPVRRFLSVHKDSGTTRIARPLTFEVNLFNVVCFIVFNSTHICHVGSLYKIYMAKLYSMYKVLGRGRCVVDRIAPDDTSFVAGSTSWNAVRAMRICTPHPDRGGVKLAHPRCTEVVDPNVLHIRNIMQDTHHNND